MRLQRDAMSNFCDFPCMKLTGLGTDALAQTVQIAVFSTFALVANAQC
jgi:hypothetical protein